MELMLPILSSYDPAKKVLTLTIALPRPVELAAEYNINLDPAALFGQPGNPRPTAGRVSGVAGTLNIFFFFNHQF
jgi:hypothetical protein